MPRPKAPCGTYSAYKRHLREGTTVDAACAAARDERTKQVADDRRAAKRLPRALSIVPDVVEPDPERLERADVLRGGLTDVRAAIAIVRQSEPARLAPLLKEMRELARELAEIETAGSAANDSLASQLAAARAARQTGS